MNKNNLLLILVVLISILLLFGCTNVTQLEENIDNDSLSDADLNLPLVEDKNNGNVFSNLDDFKRVKVGDNVSVHYIGTLLNGEKFDSSYDRGATLDFVAGAGQMIKGFDDAVIGMRVGEKKIVEIPPKEAYGEINENNIQVIPINDLPDLNFQIGEVFIVGSFRLKVYDLDDSSVTASVNPRLAGETLVFEIELVKIN